MSFALGSLYATSGVADKMSKDRDFARYVHAAVSRYILCDWGDTCAEDKKSNNYAVQNGERILAEYRDPKHSDWRIWIITEWDRSATTILFPEEY